MKLGFIIPEDYLNPVGGYLVDNFDNISVVNFVYKDLTEIISIVNEQQSKFDVLLFAGPSPYMYAKLHTKQIIIWDYIPRHTSSVIRALLEASHRGYDITNISIDIYSKELLTEIYKELNIDIKNTTIRICENTDIMDNTFHSEIYKFHYNSYYEHKVDCCISSFNKIHTMLTKENIPNFYVYPTHAVVNESIKKIHLNYTANINTYSQIAIVLLKINLPEKYSISYGNEYQNVLDRMKITEQVYLFANKISGSVISSYDNTYLIFATKNTLEVETQNYTQFKLLENLEDSIFSSISIGIGYGQTVVESKFNASFALEKSIKHGNNIVYVMFPNKELLGPIVISKNNNNVVANKHLEEICINTGICMSKLYQLYNIINMEHDNKFTTKDLARKCNISIRSLDRILNKLEMYGYVETVGKYSENGKGRPGRIFKLNIF